LDTGFSTPNLEVQDAQGEKGYLVFKYEEKNKQYDYLFVNAAPSAWKPAKDKEGRILDDKYFVKSSVQYSQTFQPLVELTFNNEGAEIFGELTTRLVGKPIAIFVG